MQSLATKAANSWGFFLAINRFVSSANSLTLSPGIAFAIWIYTVDYFYKSHGCGMIAPKTNRYLYRIGLSFICRKQ